MGRRRFDVFMEQKYPEYMGHWPEFGLTFAGDQDCASEVTDFSDKGFRAWQDFAESAISDLDAMPRERLTDAEVIDLDMARAAIFSDYMERDSDFRWADASSYAWGFDAIDFLTKFNGIEDPIDKITSHLKAIPRTVELGVDNMRNGEGEIPRLWLNSALFYFDGGIDMLRSLHKNPFIKQKINGDRGALSGLEDSLEDAVKSAKQFRAFLNNEVRPWATGDFAAGEELFYILLENQHFIFESTDQLKERANLMIEECDERMAGLASERGRSVNEYLEEIRANHPRSHELKQAYMDAHSRVVAAVKERDLVTFPRIENLQFIDTPPAERHLYPFAAYMVPCPGDASLTGMIQVTPTRSISTLREQNFTSIDQTVAHEGMPGHHLQFALERQNGMTPARLMGTSATFYEGWTMYMENLLVEQGINDTPEHEMWMMKDRKWRALRILIDVGIHTEGLTYRRAVNMLKSEVGFGEADAKAEVNSYAEFPGTYLCYAIGLDMVMDLREREKQRLGPDFDLKGFHDTLLSSGSIPLSLAIRENFPEQAQYFPSSK